MDKIDGYLSSVAQKVNKTALVIKRQLDSGEEEWVLRCNGEDDVGLGNGFKQASTAIRAWIRAKAMGYPHHRHYPLIVHAGPRRSDSEETAKKERIDKAREPKSKS